MKGISSVTVIGDESLGGTYILRMRVTRDIGVRFGQFQGGEPILISQREMLYLGSAMKGLGSRVLRHALRSGDKPAHGLYEPLLAKMRKVGLVGDRFRPPTQKKLHWHIDYLLDETPALSKAEVSVTLTHAILIRSQERLEDELGEWLLAQPETSVLVPGLGASDVKGHTHLLTVQADESWWAGIPDQIVNLKSTIVNRKS
jgi:Uri superfamily endonuclease